MVKRHTITAVCREIKKLIRTLKTEIRKHNLAWQVISYQLIRLFQRDRLLLFQTSVFIEFNRHLWNFQYHNLVIYLGTWNGCRCRSLFQNSHSGLQLLQGCSHGLHHWPTNTARELRIDSVQQVVRVRSTNPWKHQNLNTHLYAESGSPVQGSSFVRPAPGLLHVRMTVETIKWITQCHVAGTGFKWWQNKCIISQAETQLKTEGEKQAKKTPKHKKNMQG